MPLYRPNNKGQAKRSARVIKSAKVLKAIIADAVRRRILQNQSPFTPNKAGAAHEYRRIQEHENSSHWHCIYAACRESRFRRRTRQPCPSRHGHAQGGNRTASIADSGPVTRNDRRRIPLRQSLVRREGFELAPGHFLFV